ncbi:hypothetical protein QWJ07_21695 [Frankia sp. RB7]|nr:hypothetical protein [Frankia sp. RB7]
MSETEDYSDVAGFAQVINSRLASEARVAKAIGFGWLCAGGATALCLFGGGVAAAFYGYSTTQSVSASAEQVAKAISEAFSRATIHTAVDGELTLSPDAALTLSLGQTVKLTEEASVALDPNSSVRVVGDFKVDVPQPSKQQLQLDTTSSSKELPFTQYTVFKGVAFGSGYVVTSWNFDLADTSRPYYQRCYYEQNLEQGIAATQTIAVDGSPRPVSAIAKLPFDFDGAVSSCIWFSG